MTAIAIPDELNRQVEEVARAQGQTTEQFVNQVLSQAVRGARFTMTMKNGIPVMVAPEGTPPIDPAMIREALEEEGF
jgi:hypothetical protein